MNSITKTPADLSGRKIYGCVVLFILLISIIPRFYDIMKFLPVYSIDENDIVEFAAGFLGGNLDPHWYKYGPLYAYVLTAIYGLQALFSSLSFAKFVEEVFFNPVRFYFTARLVNALINILIALFTFRLAKKFFSRQVAWISLVLAVFPFFDILVSYTIRVDTLLALWTVLALYYLLKLQQEQGMKNYIMAALFWGLSLATKPLPALLLLPAAFLAHWLSFAARPAAITPQTGARKKEAKSPPKIKNRSVAENLVEALTNPAFYIFLLTGIGISFLANPYSLINFNDFKMEQIRALQSEGGRNFIAGWDISRFFNNLGYVFTLLAAAVVIYYFYQAVKKKNYRNLVLLSYGMIFWLAFAPGAAREYFYVPVIPVLIIFIAQFLEDLSLKIVRSSPDSPWRQTIILAGLLLILLQPATAMIGRSWQMNNSRDYRSRHTALAGKKWIEENIPLNSKILLYGYYPNLPHLVDRDAQRQAQYGEYFMYFRWKNKFLTEHFLQAHADYLKAKSPVYQLENIRDSLRDKEAQLFAVCRQNNIDYLISSYDLSRFGEFNGRIMKKFDQPDYPFGVPFTIYKLKD